MKGCAAGSIHAGATAQLVQIPSFRIIGQNHLRDNFVNYYLFIRSVYMLIFHIDTHVTYNNPD